MAGIAGEPGGVVGGGDLGESKWFGDVRFVTADAEHSGVEFLGVDGAGVVDMFGERTVAGLAVDVDVPAALLFFQDIRMAVFAGLVTGVIHGTSGDFGWGISTVVSILSETLGHQEGTHSDKGQAADDEDSGEPKEVSGILEGIHRNAALQIQHFAAGLRCAESHTAVFMGTSASDLGRD
jgi:hypothetical protein